jgi:phosphatidylglycerol lysyltransferase
MGDPVGPPSARAELVWSFREACDRFAARPVFYQVGAENLPIYIDAGLSLAKLGEEARVELRTFDLEGAARAELRRVHRRAQREGVKFEVIPVADVRSRLPAMRAVSDDWLSTKGIAEKGFSLGSFDPDYLGNFDCAAASIDGRLVAFANLWRTDNHAELSVDLMRHASDAPRGLMDYLFTEIMLWGKQAGYRWFNLGMAPLSGLQDREFAPMWNRTAAFLYRHGEHFYNFEGLRHYKEKFDPQWRPRYLASTGGWALPRVLVDVTSLIAGGPRKLLMRQPKEHML